jgi:murein L,D-transpeptidase YcbB/YkuD
MKYLPIAALGLSLITIAPAGIARASDTATASAQSGTSTSMWQGEIALLDKVLRQYRELAQNGGWPTWKPGKILRPGQSDPRIPTLRQMLVITGDYPAYGGVASHSRQFDDTLVNALKRFQLRHGLNADGHLGRETQMALTVPVEKRISQIMATQERMRERATSYEPKFILVNLPAYRLYGFEGGKPALTMRVIIGNRQNHTPLFDNEVTDVVFNPPWSVPQRIARNELIPKMRKNPAYFMNAGFVITQDGQPVDPVAMANSEDTNFSFRQLPGADNALGKIKFNIPDADNIYLHSTSTPRLFAKDDRALSHGCVRLEKPRELAYFVMGQEDHWDKSRIDKAYDSDSLRYVKVSHVPVHLVYWTAFVDSAGTPYFYNDVYQKDNAVSVRLQNGITLASQ